MNSKIKNNSRDDFQECLNYFEDMVKSFLSSYKTLKEYYVRERIYHRCMGVLDYAFLVERISLKQWSYMASKLYMFLEYTGEKSSLEEGEWTYEYY